MIDAQHTEIAEICRETIKEGSKSFSLASLLFPKQTQIDAHLLYRWCRTSDDTADEATDQNRASQVATLKERTVRVLNGEPAGATSELALSLIVKRYAIPSQYPLDLIHGFEMDVDNKPFETIAELEVYCYHVAGVVGLMMSYIMGVSSDKALPHANAMGCAMQLTNIARDIRLDWEMGRIYLPFKWLREEQVDITRLLDQDQRDKLVTVVTKLLNRAEELYQFGEQGLGFLSFRAAMAVASARWIYSAIGRKVRRLGGKAWDQRVYVTLPEKIWLVARAFGTVIKSRLKKSNRWKRQEIQAMWRPQ